MGDDPDILALLTTARTEFEGSAMVATLEAEGIPAKVFATGANTLQWEGGYTNPIKVMVRRRDLGRAADALRANRQASVDLDWSQVDVGVADEGESFPSRRRFGRPAWTKGVRSVGFVLLGAAMIVAFRGPQIALPVLIVAVVLIIAGFRGPQDPGQPPRRNLPSR